MLVCSAILAVLFIAVAQSMNDNVKNDVVDMHNRIRASVGIKRTLTWDSTIEAYAKTRVAYQIRSCLLSHEGLATYGENLAYSSGTPVDVNNTTFVRHLVSLWARQAAPFQIGQYNHFTQMVWGATSLVGCAVQAGCDNLVFLSCNYYEPGNFEGEDPSTGDVSGAVTNSQQFSPSSSIATASSQGMVLISSTSIIAASPATKTLALPSTVSSTIAISPRSTIPGIVFLGKNAAPAAETVAAKSTSAAQSPAVETPKSDSAKIKSDSIDAVPSLSYMTMLADIFGTIRSTANDSVGPTLTQGARVISSIRKSLDVSGSSHYTVTLAWIASHALAFYLINNLC